MNDKPNPERHQDRPPRIERRLRPLVLRSVNAMNTLNDREQRVWVEVLHLDQNKNGEQAGCYISLEHLAERLGKPERAIKDARTRLKARGFLASKNRQGYRNDAWYATLPIPLPEPIHNPSPEDIAALRDQLDATNSGTQLRTSVANSGTSNGNSDTRLRTCLIRTEHRTEPSTEQRTEPTAGIREEEGLDILETFKKKGVRRKDGNRPPRRS